MKTNKLTVKEITELQPTSVAEVKESRTVVGGLEVYGEYNQSAVNDAVKKLFGSDCKAWEGEPDEGDGCVHVIVYHML